MHAVVKVKGKQINSPWQHQKKAAPILLLISEFDIAFDISKIQYSI